MFATLAGTPQPVLLASSTNETVFLFAAGAVALIMLLWDTVEVGRNDAANLVNAVFGSRVLARRTAVLIAGVAVVLGAAASSQVMDTARKGIFDPAHANLDVEKALAIYISVYIVDTVLLYSYSAFGMPVSTTACLVFELLGAAFALGGPVVVKWPKAGTVLAGIVCSIAISGVAAFFLQRIVRGAIRDRTTRLSVLLAHGGWIGGGMLAGLTYFMLVKGMKNVAIVKHVNKEFVQQFGPLLTLLALWAVFALIIHLLLVTFGKRAARLLFPVLAVVGMLAMAFAFGQNDLANCAAPGLAALNILQHYEKGVAVATEIDISVWALAGCGFLMAVGMLTKNSLRVTSAAVHAGSMAHQVRLWAPNWCIVVARVLLRLRGSQPVLAPLPTVTDAGKTRHYDALRACVILAVSASVIATASGFGLPVSTTYVSFAAIVATGMADRIFQRGDAELKLARTIWVVFSWFAAAVIAAVSAGVVCLLVYYVRLFGIGIVIAIGANLTVRHVLKKRADAQEVRVREAARERQHPEQYAEVYED